MISKHLFFQTFLLFLSTFDAALNSTSKCDRDAFITKPNGNQVIRNYLIPKLRIKKTIGELTEVNTTIMSVCVDNNGFSRTVDILITSGNTNQQFSMHNYNDGVNNLSWGNVILNNSLDYENGPQFYTLNIIGLASYKNAKTYIDPIIPIAYVRINIIDENEPPVFIDEPYIGFVWENMENGVRNVSKVTARDFDFNGNQTVSYALENALGWFEIDEVSGEISTVTVVDREHVSVNQDVSQYLLRVTANDDGDPELTSTATVTITIRDKNDNAPVKGDGWNLTMCKNPAYAVRRNTSILNVEDYDSKLFSLFNFTKLNSEDWSFFDLENGSKTDNAQLVIPKALDDYVFEKNLYELPVQIVDTSANDHLSHTSTQTVSIHICQCNVNDAIPICNYDVVSPDDDNTIKIVIIVVMLSSVVVAVLAVITCKRHSCNKLREKKRVKKRNDIELNKKKDNVDKTQNTLLSQVTHLSSPNLQDVGDDLLPKKLEAFTVAEHSVTDVTGDDISKRSKFLMKQIPLVSQDCWHEAALPAHENGNKTSNRLLNIHTSLLAEKTRTVTTSDNLNFDASSFLTSSDDADIVGVGSYGVVRRCVHSVLGNVVIKCMHCAAKDGLGSKYAEARKRVQVFTRFDHEHIVRFHGLTSWGNCFGMVMDEIKCGNLHDLILGNKQINIIDWRLRFRIISQLASALKYLHCHDPNKSYVHLDIKPENILMTINLCVKLADFGALDIAIATDASITTDISAAKQYTPLYTAPERFKDKTKSSSSMDVYSFAMICYEVITRQSVFSDATANVHYVISEIVKKGQKPNMEPISNEEQKLKQESLEYVEIFEILQIIMKKCWCFEPNDRLSMNEVCKMLIEFAGRDDPYEAELKDHIDDVANIILHDQKPLSTSKQKVPLDYHQPPFSVRQTR